MIMKIALVSILLVGCSEAASTTKDSGAAGDSTTGQDSSTQDSGGNTLDSGLVVDGSLCGHTVLDPKNTPLVVNELLAKGSEFFELYNTSSTAIDLSGLSVADTDDDGGCPKTSAALTFPQGTSIAGGAYIVVNTGQAMAGQCDAGCFNATYKISNGTGETIFVLGTGGDITTTGTYPPNAAPAGKSWARLPNGTGDFAAGTPSPGAANIP